MADLMDEIPSELPSDVLELVKSHAWVPLAALVINFAVRQLKSDAKLPIDVPARYRSLAALVLGLLSGVLQAVVGGAKWADALVGGVVSTALALMTHEVGSTAILDGKNLMPAIGKRKDSIPPPPSPPPPAAPFTSLLVAILFGVFLVGCVGNFEEAAKPRLTLGSAAPVRDEVHCAGLDADRRGFTWASWAEGVSAGATGAVAGALVGVDDRTKAWRLGLGVSSGVLAGAAVTTTVFATNAANAWAKDCSGAGAAK